MTVPVKKNKLALTTHHEVSATTRLAKILN